MGQTTIMIITVVLSTITLFVTILTLEKKRSKKDGRIEKRLEDLKCEKQEGRLLEIEKEQARSKERNEHLPCNDHRDDIKKISNDLTDIKVTLANNIAQRHSPISLTEKGLEIANMLKADDLINKHWSTIKSIIDKENPNNLYDIQIISINLFDPINKILDEEEVTNIKNCAYMKGETISSISVLLGILVRDKYIKENNIKLSKE
jgi:hypothetical protein